MLQFVYLNFTEKPAEEFEAVLVKEVENVYLTFLEIR
jgi:hypothetical protein